MGFIKKYIQFLVGNTFPPNIVRYVDVIYDENYTLTSTFLPSSYVNSLPDNLFSDIKAQYTYYEWAGITPTEFISVTPRPSSDSSYDFIWPPGGTILGKPFVRGSDNLLYPFITSGNTYWISYKNAIRYAQLPFPPNRHEDNLQGLINLDTQPPNWYSSIKLSILVVKRSNGRYSAALLNSSKPSSGYYVFEALNDPTTLYDSSITEEYEPYAPPQNNPYNPGGTSTPSGGGGTFGEDEVSDLIDFPIGSVDPNTSNAGLFTKYVMTAAQMSQLGEYFWSTDFADSVERELISKMYGNPSDTIISIMALPVDPRDFGIASGSEHIFFGSVDSGIPSNGVLSNTAVNINWGSIQINEYYGSFLDYAPHTKIELYLPWSTGFVSIDPNDVVGGSISVSSNLEFDKGTCTHIVSGKNGVIGTYDGVFGKQVPISALDTGGKYLTAIMGAVGAAIAGTIAVGGAALAGAATATTAANAAAGTGIATMSQSSYAMGAAAQKALIAAAPTTAEYMGIYAGQALPVFAGTSLAAFRTPSHVMRNGNFTGNTAGMNVQYPFIRVSRPTQSVPENYGNYVGYPSNIYSRLGNLRGYTEVAAIHLEGFSATVDEKNEISELLKGGVIL